MKKLKEISINGDHLYIDGKPIIAIYQVADNTYLITTFPERCKLMKQQEKVKEAANP